MPDTQNLEDYNQLMPLIIQVETEQAKALGALLLQVLKPQSVIDWGCGPGLYLLPFQQAGCRILGVDGCPTAGHDIPGNFKYMDFREGGLVSSMFDLAICIEVGEHLYEEYADGLIKAITLSATHVFWSAAHKNQGGLYHYNEQDKPYWVQKFAKRGFRLHPDNNIIDTQIMINPVYVSWLRENFMLFTGL